MGTDDDGPYIAMFCLLFDGIVQIQHCMKVEINMH